ncbi:MAG: Ig-like domain repeat protein [Bacillota bacterium]|nr:Ig-like domain repeat protein [Bacillota bacterium]
MWRRSWTSLVGGAIPAGAALLLSLIVSLPALAAPAVTIQQPASPVWVRPGQSVSVYFTVAGASGSYTSRLEVKKGEVVAGYIERTNYWGSVTVPIASDAASRRYDLVVTVTDASGAGTETKTDWVVVDGLPPTDPGTPSTGNTTFADPPTWSWAAASDPNLADGSAGAGVIRYWVKVGTTPGGEEVMARTDVGNVTSLTPTLPGRGTYYFSVQAEDGAGNLSGWASGSVTNSAPVIQEEPPFTQGTSNTLFWSAPPAGTSMVQVAIKAGDPAADPPGVEWDPAYGWYQFGPTGVWTCPNRQDGVTYKYWVRFKDAGGHYTPWSNGVVSTQDASGPVIDLNGAAPASGATVGAGSWTISVPVADNGIGLALSSLGLELDNAAVSGLSYDQAAHCLRGTVEITAGSHTLTARASDLFGQSTTVTWSFTAVADRPVLEAEPAFTKGMSNFLYLSSSPPPGAAQIRAVWSTTPVAEPGEGGDFHFSVTGSLTEAFVSVGAEGIPVYYWVRYEDGTGNALTPWSNRVSSIHDATPPQFDLDTRRPADGSSVTRETQTIAVAVTDAAGIDVGWSWIKVDGTPVTGLSYDPATHILSGTIGNLAVGEHTVTAHAADGAYSAYNVYGGGNAAEISWSFAVASSITSLTIITPLEGDPRGVRPGQPLLCDYYYNSNPEGPDGWTKATLTVFKGGVTAGTITLTGLPSGGNGGNAWIPISADAAEGTYSLRFRVENSDGQSAEVVVEDCVKVDGTAPQASAASVPGGISFSPAPTWSLGYNDPLLLDGTAGSGVDKFRVKYGTTPGGDDLVAETELFEVTEYTPPPVTASGTYYLSVRAVDRAGNISGWTVASVQIVLEGPVMQAEPSVTKGLYNTVYWTNLPGTCQVKVYRDLDTTPDNGSEYVYTSPAGEPPPSQFEFQGFPGLTFYYYVYCRDQAGNWSPRSNVTCTLMDNDSPGFEPASRTPAPESWLQNGNLTVSVVVTDPTSGIDPAACALSVDGNPVANLAYDANTHIMSGTVSGLAEGSHTVLARAVDRADAGGNAAEITWTFGVDPTPVALTAPTPAPDSFTNNPGAAVTLAYDARAAGLDPSANAIQLRRSDYQDGNPVTDRDGSWTATGGPGYESGLLSYTPGNLADGQWTVTVNGVRDRAGNVVDYGAWTFGVDTTAPSEPGVPVGPPAFTNDSTPTWQWKPSEDFAAPDNTDGSGVAEYRLELWTGSGELLVKTQTPLTEWTGGVPDRRDPRLVTPLPDGAYSLKVAAEDGAGNVSGWSVSPTVVVDTAPPLLSGPLPNGPVNEFPAILGAGFSDGGSGYGSLTSFILTLPGGQPVNVALASQPNAGDLTGSFQAPLPVEADQGDGEYLCSLTVQDRAGNSATLPWTFFLDTQAPAAPTSLTGPSAVTNSPTFTWSGASDPVPGSGLASYLIEFWQGDSLMQSCSANYAPDPFTWTPSAALPSGTYAVRVWSVDAAGNQSPTYAATTVTLDTTPPTAPGAPSATTPTNDTTPLWTWTAASDGESGLSHYEVKLGTTAGGSELLAPVAVGNVTAWATDLDASAPDEQGLADGSYYLSVRAWDNAGNAGPWATCAAPVVVDTIAPAVSSMSPAGPTNDNTPAVSFTIVEEGSGVKTSGTWEEGAIHVVLSHPEAGTRTVGSGFFTQSGQVWSVTAFAEEPLADGIWTGTLDCADNAGNHLTTYSFSLVVDTQAPSRPATLTAPGQYIADATPSFTWSGASDAGSGLAGYRAEVWSGGARLRGPYSVSFAPDSCTWTVPEADALPDGAHELRVWSVDAAGNESPTYAAVAFTVDTAPMPLSNPLPAGESWVGTGLFTLQCDFSDLGGTGVDSATIRVAYTNRDSSLSGTLTPGATNFSCANSGTGVDQALRLFSYDKLGSGEPTLPDGQWTVTVSCADRAGNASTPLQWTFHVDTAPPVVSNLEPSPGSFWAGRSALAAEIVDPALPDGSPGAGVKLEGLQAWLEDSTGNRLADLVVAWEGSTALLSLPDGFTPPPEGTALSVKLTAADLLDNGSQVSAWSLTWDATAPSLQMVSPAEGVVLDLNASSTILARVQGGCAGAEVSVDGGEPVPATILNGNLVFHFLRCPLAAGRHSVKVRVWDAAGNAAEQTVSFTVEGYRRGFGFGRLRFPPAPQN